MKGPRDPDNDDDSEPDYNGSPDGVDDDYLDGDEHSMGD